MNRFAQSRYFRLRRAEAHRELTPAELKFVDQFELKHPASADLWEAETGAMEALRGATLNPKVSEGFTLRVLRLHRVTVTRAQVQYWTPAFLGAALAAVALLAMLQIMASSTVPKNSEMPNGAAAQRTDRTIQFLPENALQDR